MNNKTIDFEKTGLSVQNIQEYIYKDVRFLYKKGKKNKICCFFASAVKENSEQRYHYVKEFNNRDETCLWFLDTPHNTGTFYIDKNFKYIKSIIEIINSNLKKESDIFLFGSSKGAVGALLVYSFLEKGKLVIHAPQYDIASFLKQTDNKNIISLINKLSEIDIRNKNIIEKRLNDISINNASKMIISCGLDDGFHLRKQLPSLFKLLKSKNFLPMFLPLNGSHNNISVLEYQQIIKNILDNNSFYFLQRKTEEMLIWLKSKDVDEVLIDSLIYPNIDFIISQTVKDKIDIISYNNRILIKLPLFYNTLYALYYRDNRGTNKLPTYTKTNTFEIDIEGEIKELTFFLKADNKISTIKLNNDEIKSKCLIIKSESFNNITRYDLENETKQIEAYISVNSFLKPKVPLPQMRHWVISPDFARLLIEQIMVYKPEKIVEFGSGVSSIIIGYILQKLGKGQLISFDHNEIYANKTKNNICLHQVEEYVTIHSVSTEIYHLNSKKYKWYDLNKFMDKDMTDIDMVIVDGPPASFNPEARYPAIPIIYNNLNKNCVIIMDDGIRSDEKNIADKWSDEYDFTKKYIETEKGCFILKKKEKS